MSNRTQMMISDRTQVMISGRTQVMIRDRAPVTVSGPIPKLNYNLVHCHAAQVMISNHTSGDCA